jgi:hypothetical protein
MITSLWPSQNASLSITQAAARLHIEHWMNFMVNLRTVKRDAMFRIPSVLFGTTSQAADLLGAACVISSTSFLRTPKLGTLARDWTPWWSRIE